MHSTATLPTGFIHRSRRAVHASTYLDDRLEGHESIRRLPTKVPRMLLAHALTLAEARSCLAALADTAETFDASVEYERTLLQLDFIHGDDSPALDTEGLTQDRQILLTLAISAIEELVGHGVDALQVELVLDMLEVARDKDRS